MSRASISGALGLAIALSSAGCGGSTDITHSMATVPIDVGARPVLNLQWQRNIAGASARHNPQEFASAALSETGHRLYLGSTWGQLQALMANTGEVLWTKQIASMSARATVHDEIVYIGTDDGFMLALDALDGREMWRYQAQGAILEAPVIHGDLLLFSDEADHVFALDRAKGVFRWQYKSEIPEEFTVRGHSGVAIAGDYALAGFSNGSIVALRPSTGSVAWITSLRGGVQRFVDVDATPVTVGDLVIAASSAGGVYGLDLATGRVRWRVPVAGAGPMVSDDTSVYFCAAEQGVYRLDLHGNILWRQGTRGGGEPAKPVISGNYLVYSLSEAGLFIADRETGAVRQYFDPGFGVSAPATVDGNRMYVLSNAGTLYAFALRLF